MELSEDGRLERRRRALVDAARSLFIEQGFERTTLADVVQRAGGSLATLYKLFGNKAGLLSAVVRQRTRSSEDMIAGLAESGLAPAEALRRIGEQLHKVLLDPEQIAMSRIVIAYSLEDAEFASGFYQETLLQSQRTLTEVFTRWRDEGVELQGAPAVLAEIFLGIFVYEVHSEAISHGAMSGSGTREMSGKIDFFCRGAGFSC